ncbi:hypothetical protein [Streptomyces rhizosphaericus]|uniref:hypothetical protein n=1 Tax=Streptomyces rhizosphaericus TaxID=114699 RepID=UPI000A3C6251|nr:hypothetical protein [Streptomyces rhizosphaericus]
MLPLWKRGDTLAQGLAVLHGIAEDSTAGRAERHDMIDAFTGLDRYIPRPVRAQLIAWQEQGRISLSRTSLPDLPEDTDLLAGPHVRWPSGGGRSTVRCGVRPWPDWSTSRTEVPTLMTRTALAVWMWGGAVVAVLGWPNGCCGVTSRLFAGCHGFRCS